jgi:hypothetical protein
MNSTKKASPILAVLILLFSCSGSDAYQGKWKATDSKGNKFEIIFSPKSFSVKDSAGKSTDYSYTQNSYNHENSVTTYGIQLEDGRGYQINFPKSDDETVGLLKDGNGMPVYTLSRKNYLTYDELYKLNF